MGSTSDRLGPPIIVAIVAISATVVTLLLKLNISCVPRVGVIITIIVQYLVIGHLSWVDLPHVIFLDMLETLSLNSNISFRPYIWVQTKCEWSAKAYRESHLIDLYGNEGSTPLLIKSIRRGHVYIRMVTFSNTERLKLLEIGPRRVRTTFPNTLGK